MRRTVLQASQKCCDVMSFVHRIGRFKFADDISDVRRVVASRIDRDDSPSRIGDHGGSIVLPQQHRDCDLRAGALKRPSESQDSQVRHFHGILALIVLLFAASAIPSQAATRSVFVGGLYVDALPTGVSAPIERIVLYPGSRLETQTGRIDFPAGEAYGPMFLALSEQGDRFVGLAHDIPGRLLLYHAPHGWEPLDLPTSGRVVFDASGGILDLNPAGYQYFDEATNQPVSRIDTYGPLHGLSEWVKVGDLYIGQGHANGGIKVWDGSRLRVLDEGLCFFLRRHVRGDRVALSYVKSGEGAVVWQTTISELRALPIEPSATETRPPAPPVLTPPPVVEPPQALPDTVRAKAIVVAERAKYPAPSMSALHIVELLKNVARRLNAEGFEGGPFGVLVKTSGSNCSGYSCDIICVGNGSAQKQWDVLGNADPMDGPPEAHGGTQTPGWDGPLATIAVRTCEVPSGGPPPPPPPPPPPVCGWPDQRVLVAQLSDDVDAKARRIATLDREKAACESHLNDVEQELIAVRQELDALKAKPAPTCTAKVETSWARSLGAKASCTINR